MSRVTRNTALIFASAILAAAPLGARTLAEDAQAFGARESLQDLSLSPSGSKIAYIAPVDGHGEALRIVDYDGGGAVSEVFAMREPGIDITNCDWASERFLVCSLFTAKEYSGAKLGVSRLFSVDTQSGEFKMLSPERQSRAMGVALGGGSILAHDVEGEENAVLMTRIYVPEERTSSRIGVSREGLGVVQIDLVSGREKIVVQPDKHAAGYIADNKGNVRIKLRQLENRIGYDSGRFEYLYQPVGSRDWEPLSTRFANSRDGFQPVAVDAEENAAYGFADVDGRYSLVRQKLDGSSESDVLVSREDVDVDGIVRLGRSGRIVGASYATDRRMVEYFEPELDTLASALEGALPGNPAISVVGASADEDRLLIAASGDTQPGMLYLFNRGSSELNELLPVRDELSGVALARMQPITYTAGDGTRIPGYLTLPPGREDARGLPAIVMPHGGPSARDELGFDWLSQYFAARGYAVLQPNYRGSSGYGEAWLQENGFQSWPVAIGDINDAGRWLVSEGIADPGRLAIVGWSYGGYAALQSQVVDPDLFKAVVAIAPVTSLRQLIDDSRRYTNFKQVADFVGEGPHVDAGSPSQHASRFSAPVMLFHGDMDLNVDVTQSRLMAARLEDAGQRVTYREYEGLRHSLRDSNVRASMLGEIGQFLDTELGG